MAMPGDVDEQDRALLEQAAAWLRNADPRMLRGDWSRELARERGIDFATAALYWHVCSTRPADWLAGDGESASAALHKLALADLTVAVAPGAFYKEHPWTGADGAAIRESALSLGCNTALIPTASVGTLAANAETIVSWLAERSDQRIVLVSLSKGGADVKAALALPRAAKACNNLVAWINVGGVTDGSPMVAWLLQRRLATLIYRFLFWRRGRDFQFIRDLDRRLGAPLDFELVSPLQLRMIHVVGFPLQRHLRCKRAIAWRRRLSPWGPNDGAIILADSCKLPGTIVPVWGADHFSKGRVDLPALTARLLRAIAIDSSQAARDSAALNSQDLAGAAL
jgi:hypothetical protein